MRTGLRHRLRTGRDHGGLKVILIEGSRPYASFQNSWLDKGLLYNGEMVGPFAGVEADFLVASTDAFQTFPRERERVFGGTSTHWGGLSRPEDPNDLEDRPGFPGWPVTREELRECTQRFGSTTP